MYHWVDDKDYLKRVKRCCSDVVNQLVQSINNEGIMTVRQHLVGSGAKNLITQNEKEPIDLDYNLEILDCERVHINDCRFIKDYILEKFSTVLNRCGWGSCCDSTSAMSTHKRAFKKGNKTPFSIDLCVIKVSNDGRWFRLIHHKTGIVQFDRYFWNEAQRSKGLTDRIEWLKENGFWNDVRDTYLEKKNRYLRMNDHNHSSFNIYIESVNEIYYHRRVTDRSFILSIT